MASVHRATLLSFDLATYTAQVLIEGSDMECKLPVGQWLPSTMMVADAELAVLLFDPTNTDDALVIGPYGGTPLETASITVGGLNVAASPVSTAGAGQIVSTTLNAGTTDQASPFVLDRNSTGTPAPGYGINRIVRLDNSANALSTALLEQAYWTTATAGAMKSAYDLYVYDNTTPRPAIQVRATAGSTTVTMPGTVNVGGLQVSGTNVVGTRKTGWGTPTGTQYRTALTNASTQAQFNQALMALIVDLISHGLIGA